MKQLEHEEPRIVVFRPLGAARFRLLFRHGQWIEVDLGHLVPRGNLFGRLADDQYLAQAEIMDEGYYLSWPGELDMSAGSLWLQGSPVGAMEVLEPVVSG